MSEQPRILRARIGDVEVYAENAPAVHLKDVVALALELYAKYEAPEEPDEAPEVDTKHATVERSYQGDRIQRIGFTGEYE